MRFGIQHLGTGIEARSSIGTENGYGLETWIHDPDDLDPTGKIELDLLVDLFLLIAGREYLHR
jgi:hypothetical protein